MMGKEAPNNNFMAGLEFSIPETVDLYPYEDIPGDEWGTVRDAQGKFIPLPENWRRLGFRVKYPDTQIENNILRYSTSASMEKMEGMKGKTPREHFDVVKLQKYYVYHVIVRAWEKGKENDAPAYDDKSKEFFREYFLRSPFLWRKFSDAYYELRQESEAERKALKENFTPPSEDMPESI